MKKGRTMKELSKSIMRRIWDPSFMRRYFVGDGIDIGGQPDPLTLYCEMFPLMRNVKIWDAADGDAQFMTGIPDASFDFVHSSHCLEHICDPRKALQNWLRILKPGGFLIVMVPDEDLYEQGVFPSTYNKDHKHTFTIYKHRSWSDHSINVVQLLLELGSEAYIEKVELLAASYRFSLPRYDQTMTPIGECAIEFVVRKLHSSEVETGVILRNGCQPPANLRVHYNQYLDDHKNLKQLNLLHPPFRNDGEL
jgi:SAM-dependent methyltransferase